MICFSWKTLWKVEELFLEYEKILFTLNSFFILGSFFNAESSAHDHGDKTVRILGKEGVDACFTFEVDALLDAEGLRKVKEETLDSLFKWG